MLQRLWTASPLPIRIKALMYNTLVRPVALYGAETWVPLPSQEHILDVADMGWIRQIVGVSLRQEIPNPKIRRRAQCLVTLSATCR